ncbi:hypothetical protein BDV59DRAFT_205522 [Aspergillus ambiguus]|uniref:uncharacterized protein n=1 Tax=Aspergillus ambiguus TaxID=176160 RepID=UPI003CCDFDBC
MSSANRPRTEYGARKIDPARDTSEQNRDNDPSSLNEIQVGRGRDPPLSKEEFTLYSTLETSGALRSVLNNPDLDSTRPLFDEDLRRAIDTLNTSTAAIQRQTEVLTTQCETLNRQIRLEDERNALQNRDIERLRQKHDAGRQRTAVASSDVARDLDTSVKNESEKATADGKRILSLLSARLKEDDRILADLEKLASGITSTGDDASISKKTSQLGSLLSQCVAEEIQCRLDRLYLESLYINPGDPENQLSMVDDEATAALEEELELLYSEIDVLSEISTKQQFSEPILRELQNHHGQMRIAAHEKLDLILHSMIEMTSSTEFLTKSLHDRESFCGAFETFVGTYRSEIGNQFSEQTSSRRDTLKRRSIQQALKPPTGNAFASIPESQVLAGLLRRLGLSFESVFQSEEEDGGANALADKREHLLECLQNYGIAADSPLIAETASTDQATRLLLSALHADSHVETSLSDAENENRLTKLEAQLGMVQKGMERIDMDSLYRRDKNQERFLETWS